MPPKMAAVPRAKALVERLGAPSDARALGSASVGIDLQFQFRDTVGEFSTRRRQRLMGRLRNVCPHIRQFVAGEADGGREVPHLKPAFESPAGTVGWYCVMCGLEESAHGYQILRRHLEREFERDPSGTLERLAADRAKADKLIAKINRLGGTP